MLVTALYALELAVVLGGLALYKKGDRPVAAFWSHPAGLAFIAAAVLFVGALVVIVREGRRQPIPRARWLAPPLASCQ